MPNALPNLDLDLGDLNEVEWMARLDALGEEHGFARALGAQHHAVFIEAGKRLLVTFESVDQARRNPGALPRGFDQVTRNGWSVLCLFSRGETWFRDPAVWRAFDRWTDEGFLEDFERVLFVGTGSGGYAAAAFSVAAPGARVLALRPYATLDPAVAGWDRRHPAARRKDWTTRYGYAPAMLDAADRAVVLHDPALVPDSMHASLFTRPNVTSLRVPHTGGKLDSMLEGMSVLPVMMDLAMESGLDQPAFARLWRNRRNHAPYLRALLRHLELQGRRGLAARVCHFGLNTVDRPLFARKLAELNAKRPQPAAAAPSVQPYAPAAGQPPVQAAE